MNGISWKTQRIGRPINSSSEKILVFHNVSNRPFFDATFLRFDPKFLRIEAIFLRFDPNLPLNEATFPRLEAMFPLFDETFLQNDRREDQNEGTFYQNEAISLF